MYCGRWYCWIIVDYKWQFWYYVPALWTFPGWRDLQFPGWALTLHSALVADCPTECRHSASHFLTLQSATNTVICTFEKEIIIIFERAKSVLFLSQLAWHSVLLMSTCHMHISFQLIIPVTRLCPIYQNHKVFFSESNFSSLQEHHLKVYEYEFHQDN